ncbi:tRNA (guanine-N2-)-methyltransferase [Sporobolomyces koalae]|uniref:tRNA (guanine-N2-)-methyltransferase n=1 Tax=Sporobolomyces koalae TaxID=500713 RepID=UPI0031795F09
MSSPQLYLFSCATGPLESFRLAELEAIANLFNIRYSFPHGTPDESRPYMVVELPGEREAKLLATRLVSVKHIWELWAHGDDYEQVHAVAKQDRARALWEPYAQDRNCTWKFVVAGHNRTIPLSIQIKTINTFSYMAFPGDIDLKRPQLEIGVFEEYEFDGTRGSRIVAKRQELGVADVKGKKKQRDEEIWDGQQDYDKLKGVWVGRKISDCQRGLIDYFDLKKRKYIGTTSMEAEASLLMANQAQAAPGKWVYDPFAGTGSMLLTAAGFGAMTFGSDIDGRQMRGKKTNISDSANQYGVTDRIVDCASFDMNQHPFRTGQLFDAIVTDPPYGVRAGAKRTGREEGARAVLPTVVPGREKEGFHHQFDDYVPPSVGWPMEEVITTLITFSLYMLKPRGRLVFFLPTNESEYSDVDVPEVPGFRLISNTSQSFGKWARRLITMEKLEDVESERIVIEGLDRGIERERSKSEWTELERNRREEKKPGHADFRERYYEGFGTTKRQVNEANEASLNNLSLDDQQEVR